MTDDTDHARAEEHRAKAWEHRMRAIKEGALTLLTLLFGIIVCLFAYRLWNYM